MNWFPKMNRFTFNYLKLLILKFKFWTIEFTVDQPLEYCGHVITNLWTNDACGGILDTLSNDIRRRNRQNLVILKGVTWDFSRNRPILENLQFFTTWSKFSLIFLFEQVTQRKGSKLLIGRKERHKRPQSADKQDWHCYFWGNFTEASVVRF